VLSGIAAVHGQKIVHRDMKLENVFLTKEGICKIGDFNLSKELAHSFAAASSLAGTPFSLFFISVFILFYFFTFFIRGYVPPEVIQRISFFFCFFPLFFIFYLLSFEAIHSQQTSTVLE
jgi:serine/threonine protein kinase